MSLIRPTRRGFLTGGACLAVGACGHNKQRLLAETDDDPLQAAFLTPPNVARPRVYWHWMDGHVTARGAWEDIAWMQRVGLGGVLQVDWNSSQFSSFPGVKPVDQGEGKVTMFSERWQTLTRNSVEWARQSNLEFAVMSSPGTSLTGGPWVKPEQAMKKYVWSETYIRAGQRFAGRLNPPPNVTGPFQHLPMLHTALESESTKPEYYADAAVVAYRPLPNELEDLYTTATLTSPQGVLDAEALHAGAVREEVKVPYIGDSTWVLASYATPVEVRNVQVCAYPLPKYLETSIDGTHYTRVCEFKPGCAQQTMSMPIIRARYFRFVFERPPAPFMPIGEPVTAQRLSLLRLLKSVRVHRFEDKAGFPNVRGYGTVVLDRTDETPTTDTDKAIAPGEVLNLSDQLDSDGMLHWTPPPGDWVILRFGYSLLGRSNHGPTSTGLGLEVDKLNRRHVEAYLEEYLKKYEVAVGGPLAEHGVKSVWLDSFEQGPQNWTEQFLEEFRSRRGYDPVQWLPVLAGRVVSSAQDSDNWLCDFRSTLSELFVDEHYRVIADLLHRKGLSMYSQAHELRRWFVGDGMDVKKCADIPTGAMWASVGEFDATRQERYEVDLREASSVANVYGRKLVGVEAFGVYQKPYVYAPEDFKPTADRLFCAGANRLMVAVSPHQPDDRAGPGVSTGPFGCWFTRKETWAEQARPWVDYLSRCAYLLQQGHRVADIAYLYGEDSNLTGLFNQTPETLPAGYGFDFVNASALIHALEPKDGRLLSRSGNAYRLLVLDPSTESMSLPLLRAIDQCINAGVPVVGILPKRLRGLSSNATEFKVMCERLRERIREEPPTAEVLASTLEGLGLRPSMKVEHAPAGADIHFVHRQAVGEEIFFVSNRAIDAHEVTLSFRVVGSKQPQLWYPDSGDIEVPAHKVQLERVDVHIPLEPRGSVFVVFRERTLMRSRASREKAQPKKLVALEGGWEVSISAPGRAERSIRLERLVSWPDLQDPDLKYFSGTATYRTRFTLASRPKSRIMLDLGRVKSLAEVRVNGKSAGIVWKAPFVVDISHTVQAGENELVVLVTNLWPNRLIGNEALGEKNAAEWTNFNPYTKGSPLLESGLLGPVQVIETGT